MKNRYVGIFGLMGSGKSVVINEFIYQNKEIKFLNFDAPPVQAKFRGMSLSFVDDIFAIEKNKNKINFFELFVKCGLVRTVVRKCLIFWLFYEK